MRHCLLCAVLLLAPLFAGCVRTFQPVLKDDQVAPIDPSLRGRWVSKEGTDSIDVQPAEKDGIYRAVLTDKDGKKGTLLIRLGKVGDLTLAEVSADDPGSEMNDVVKFHLLPVYSFLVVKKTSPQFVFTVMTNDWLKKYLDGNPTDIQALRRGEDILLTSSTADLQAFVLKHYKEDGAMSEDNLFVRPGDPTTQPATTPTK